jgi:uncharacterized protein (TIGR02284 family)
MPTDRAQTTEDEYFRNQEADRRRDEAWDLQRAARAAQAEHDESEASRLRRDTRAALIAPAAHRGARRGLNRLIIAGWGELLAFNEAARSVFNPDAQRRLHEKAERRRLFGRELSTALVALGGVPAKHASLRARGLALARGFRRLLIGPHQGDAYAVCADAAELSSKEYSRALRASLPDDVRFGIERQHAEVELDCRELRRLRWS